MFHLFLLPLIVFGDMCQDFCIERLGRETCHKGSYCKKNYDCHNLFWTSEEHGHICVFTGRGECTNRYPVLCSEAVVGRHVSAGILSGATTTTPMPSLVPQVQDNVIALELRFSQGFLRNHPCVKLKFQNEGRNLGYYAIFDTGSHETYIFAESAAYPFNNSHVPYEPAFRLRPGDPISRPAGEGEGYRLGPGVTPRNPETLVYGIDGGFRRFESFGSIIETITVFSGGSNRFSFHAPEVRLIRPPGDRNRALLGAQPASAFGTAAGVFAVVPSPPYSSIFSDWQLLIGHNSSNHAQRYCSPDNPTLQWFPRVAGNSYWTIGGVMWLARLGSNWMIQEEIHAVENIEMVLDTCGTDRIHLSPLMMDAVIAELESFGPRRIPSDGPYPRFSNCSYGLPLAAISLRLGIQPGPRNATMDPLSLVSLLVQYLEFDQVGGCRLKLEVGILGAPNRVLIGNAFLEKVVTVFDNLNHRVGMCRRGNNAIQD
jgi:hypothetical protein